ncbi:MAG: bacillithiol system redox-active protein YtxJ [Acidobacteria bacterium]|nr:MAG: bacillithiol system redox-active protein YtxJ [Acidobacteriota bacterium]
MDNHFVKVNDTQSLANLIARSQTAPIIIFKHSTTCGVSSFAYREMQNMNEEVNLVEIQSARAVSEEIERQLGVPHESPQVIVLRRGKAVWNASHFQIKAAAVSAAVKNNS